MVERIKDLVSSKGMVMSKFLREVELPGSAMSEWSKGKAKPSVDALTKIADYFGVSVDYLLGRTESSHLFPIKNIQGAIVDGFFSEYDENNDEQRFLLRLWEAQNEIYQANELLRKMIEYNPFGKKADWFLIFKYLIIVLDETSKLINDQSEFRETTSSLVGVSGLTSNLNDLDDFLKENQTFFNAARNTVAHFDHKSSNRIYDESYKACRNSMLYQNNDYMTDDDACLYTVALSSLYRVHYNTPNNSSNDDVINNVVSLYTKLLNTLDKVITPLIKANFKTNLVPESPINPIFITGDKNVIQQGSISNSPVKIETNINTNNAPCESECTSDHESALLSIFKKLDVIKQAQLLAYAAELENMQKDL